jgi:hypothetical protein
LGNVRRFRGSIHQEPGRICTSEHEEFFYVIEDRGRRQNAMTTTEATVPGDETLDT